MFEKQLRFIEKFIPQKIYKFSQPFYHFFLSIFGMLFYNFPARKMIMIGVTGTKGKTSTAIFIHSLLNQKYKSGLITSANIKIGEKEIENKYHMSMPGRFILQRFLSEMKKADCKYCVVEVTSEGIKQFRHLGLFLDVAIFTNLSPEHLSSHGGSYEKYRDVKATLFKKNIFNKLKYILVNTDDTESGFFKGQVLKQNQYLNLKDIIKIIDFSLNSVSDILESGLGVDFIFEKEQYHLNILGKFNIKNLLPAIILAKNFGLNSEEIKLGLEKIKVIPGRMEEIKLGQDFRLIIDYAHEKLSFVNLLESIEKLKADKSNNILIILGGDGGGRDKQNLINMGEEVGKKADFIIITNSDPYFDDEWELANTIKNSALKENDFRLENDLKRLEENKNLFVILDRKSGIQKAISLAKKDDIIILTTRGSLTYMNIKGVKVKSNDKEMVEEILQKDLKIN